MTDRGEPEKQAIDPAAWSESMAKIAEQSQRLVSEFLSRNSADLDTQTDPLNIGSAFIEMTTRMMSDPQKLFEAQVSLWQDYMTLWQTTARRMMGEPAEPVIQPSPSDRRFK